MTKLLRLLALLLLASPAFAQTYGSSPGQITSPSQMSLNGVFKFAGLPSAATYNGYTAYTSDQGIVYSNGTVWAAVGGVSLGSPGPIGNVTPSTGAFTTATANLFQIGAFNGLSFPNSVGDGSSSVAIGRGAGAAITSGFHNVFIGYLAGNAATDCSLGTGGTGYDVAIGWEAAPLDNGCENTAVGVNTLLVNTSGSFNVAIGNDAVGTSTGGATVGIGHGACGGNVSLTTPLTGSTNTCLGDGSGAYLSGIAASNTYVGGSSGKAAVASLNTGIDNVGVGWQSLTNVTTGGNNTALGFSAMAGSVSVALTGSTNTAVGSLSLQIAQGAMTNNTAIGYQSAALQTSGNANTIVGAQAGPAIAISGGFNTIVGKGTGGTLTTGSNNSLFGVGCNTAAGNTSNTIGVCAGSTAIWSVTGAGTPSSAAESFTGSIAFPNVTTGTNADFVCMSSGNVLTLQTSACTISSLRFKENVVPFRDDALKRVGALDVEHYNMKPGPKPNADPNFGNRQIGLIAENIAKVLPECAIYENDMHTPKSYRQECVIAVLVKGMQQQQVEIQNLKRLVSAGALIPTAQSW